MRRSSYDRCAGRSTGSWSPCRLPASLFIGIVLLAVLGGAAEIGALFLGVLVGGHVASDGRSNWYKGVQLLAFYLILATTFYLIPPEAARKIGRSP